MPFQKKKEKTGPGDSSRAHVILAVIYIVVFSALFAGAVYWELNCRAPDLEAISKSDS